MLSQTMIILPWLIGASPSILSCRVIYCGGCQITFGELQSHSFLSYLEKQTLLLIVWLNFPGCIRNSSFLPDALKHRLMVDVSQFVVLPFSAFFCQEKLKVKHCLIFMLHIYVMHWNIYSVFLLVIKCKLDYIL